VILGEKWAWKNGSDLFHCLFLFWSCLGDGRFVMEHVMAAIDEDKLFISPVRKLVRFFRRSRDGWKEKCQTAKAQVKQLKNGSCALRKSRDRWKDLAKRQAEELRQLRCEQTEQKTSLCGVPGEGSNPLERESPAER
jgi:hypothetical protein